MKIIKGEWFSFFRKRKAKRYTPKDRYRYTISKGVIEMTNKILEEYRKLMPSNEGFVYWAGTLVKNEIRINTVIVPETESDKGSVMIPPEANFYVVQSLSEHKLQHIGQVHSHPGSWVDHSEGDNEWASFKTKGLVSIVVPNYGKNGMFPLTTCGVHRFKDEHFIRLSKKYIQQHFKIIKCDATLIDLRDKSDSRWRK
jgi:proteasome lid subunit RPN8/RPN11